MDSGEKLGESRKYLKRYLCLSKVIHGCRLAAGSIHEMRIDETIIPEVGS
jgi:hypothetical protein